MIKKRNKKRSREAHEDGKEEATASPATAKKTSMLQPCAAVKLKWELTLT